MTILKILIGVLNQCLSVADIDQIPLKPLRTLVQVVSSRLPRNEFCP